ncbi:MULTISPECIES: glycosyltransferase [Pseudomonas]|uniref:glycosyltransferase n=1 Tax=Pseudomonas TaxID=286 RepID=UPI0006CE2942|nr:glycosyltransferase [Pseudomonas fuscovaginae]KPA96674.1 glycosyltransferase [Pseudomonas fuscovaginae]
MKLLVNASNLHFGGGVQVAASFIDELSRLGDRAEQFSVLVSTEVHDNLVRIDCKTSGFVDYEVFDTHGLSCLWASLSGRFKGYDLVFTIFGPAYFLSQNFVSIVGFAQAWIIYPDNDSYANTPKLSRYKARLRYWLQSLFFRRADRLVVEAEHVRSGLAGRGIFAAEAIDVVPNCISSLYFDPAKWEPLGFSLPAADVLRIGYVGRDYPHKNLDVLPDVSRTLREVYGVDVEFCVTLSDSEWAARSDSFKAAVKNVGVLSVSQCPSFYQQMDAVIFPSLIECFSATPLEAMVMGKPLFASDRGFVRDVCGEWANYFDPLDAEDIAKTINLYFSTEERARCIKLQAAQKYSAGFSSAKGRALSYLDIIERALRGR